ncbi:golgi-specific brefeldin A-resistance guanine nucleotide exchange factor 1 [Planoprotostelium fungivorum]|uniref:Golgi-specific brefeldin A-resistance guanine nucleotide exchange factor 1 n=1 Tax=Planoprotostelium fungivorum TaxID=1890364 RepID=A0A2P6NTP7_9EUKA|nr:golgi-specific brefeldin A-resistance guanine nucleotide exchange factor 1 [Planoprotostelium fungivorum]
MINGGRDVTWSTRGVPSLKDRVKNSLLHAEIQNVENALRKGGRWRKPLQKLQQLSHDCQLNHGIKIQGKDLFEPFLFIVSSRKSSWYLRNVTLGAIYKLVREGFVDASDAEGINYLLEVLLSIERPENEPIYNEEVVEINVLRVLLGCLQTPAGALVRHDLIMKTTRKCGEMSVQTQRSDVFQDVSERVLSLMIETIFHRSMRAHTVATHSIGHAGGDQKRMLSVSCDEFTTLPLEPAIQYPQRFSENRTPLPPSDTSHVATATQMLRNLSSMIEGTYLLGEGTESETFSGSQIEHLQLLGLSITNTLILRFTGVSDEFPTIILDTIKDRLSKSLLQGMRSSNLVVFTRVLRLFFNLYLCMKKHLKSQMQIFFSTLLTSILDPSSHPTSPHIPPRDESYTRPKQEVALQILIEFCAEPTFVTELYINYDCELTSANLFDIICKYLYKNSFPVSGALNNNHRLALTGLQTMLHSIAFALPGPINELSSSNGNSDTPPNIPPPYSLLRYQLSSETPPEIFRQMRTVKERCTQSIHHFNRAKLRDCLSLFQEYGLIPVPMTPEGVAQLFRYTPGLSKEQIGRFFSERSEFHVNTLRAFIFDVVQDNAEDKHSPLDSTLRSLMGSFRAVGDANIIGRILENFGEIYFRYHRERATEEFQFPFTSSDAVYVICYMIVMLNVDLHNHQVKNKMSLEDFVRRARESKETQDIPIDLLENLYYSVKQNELKITEENTRDVIQEQLWQSILRKSKGYGFIDLSNIHSEEKCRAIASACNKDIFSAVWGPIVSAFSVVLDTVHDEAIERQIMEGLELCASIAARLGVNKVFDNIVISVSKFSGIPYLESSQLAAFGNNEKAHRALQLLFSIVSNYGSNLHVQILDCAYSVYNLDLGLEQQNVSDFFRSTQDTNGDTNRDEARGLRKSRLSNVFTWLTGSGSQLVIADELKAESKARDILLSHSFRSLLENAELIEASSLTYLIQSIIGEMQKQREDTKKMMFLLDVMNNVVVANYNRVVYLWFLVYNHFDKFIEESSGVVQERAISNFMIVCDKLLSAEESIPLQILRCLDTISRVTSNLTVQLQDKCAYGVLQLVNHNIKYIRSQAAWMKVFQALQYRQDVSPNSLSLRLQTISCILSNGMPLTEESGITRSAKNETGITLDNFTICLQTITGYLITNLDVKLALESVRLLIHLMRIIPITQAAPNQVYDGMYAPVMKTFLALFKDPRMEVRNFAAKGYLDATESGEAMKGLSANQWMALFDKVYLPLLSELAEKKKEESATDDYETIRGLAIQMVIRTFLLNLNDVVGSTPEQFKTLWLKILHMSEKIKEWMRSVLLVMSVSGIFKPSGENEEKLLDGLYEDEELWKMSWNIIDSSYEG